MANQQLFIANQPPTQQ